MPTDILFEIKVMMLVVFSLMFSAIYYAVPKMYEEGMKPGNEFLKRMWQVEGDEKAWVTGRRRVCVIMGVLLLIILITL